MRIAAITSFVVVLSIVHPVLRAAERGLPPHCAGVAAAADESADRTWNEAYRAGFKAIEVEDYTGAETEMCRALGAARSFGPRDWRFAETLDELGLIAFQLRDYELAERMQGAAIAEMLLAVGPDGEPLREHSGSPRATIRADCRSGVDVYLKRLGWILERRSGRTSIEALQAAPWTIFEAGYLPLDAELAERLEWLVSQYLLQEQLEAAETLTELQEALRRGDRPSVASP